MVGRRRETPRVITLGLAVPGWPGHLAGQHVDVRLTGEDGHQAQRSYSLASAPGAAPLEITVETIEDGEVSPYLAGDVAIGDRFEVRGPIGGYFVWTPSTPGPLVLIAGGSGVAPLMAMLRHRAAGGRRGPALLLYSSRSLGDVIFRDELDRLAAADPGLTVAHTLTRSRPPRWTGFARRIDAPMLGALGAARLPDPAAFVCGSSGMVETAAQALIELGVAPERIRTERFGPSGG